jgi:regulator of protease activity HflC (stomatin/prohibitin superfamily)
MAMRGSLYYNGVAVTAFLTCLSVGAILSKWTDGSTPLVVSALIGLYLLHAIKVVRQWEKVALLRLGTYVGLRGPGIFIIVPVLETLSPYVDQRVRLTRVRVESAFSSDTVPVDVDAIVFWFVWNAEKAILEVEDYLEAVGLSAQTGLRESIAQHELAQLITDSDLVGRELQRVLDDKLNPWGITVQSVDVRDVRIPRGLQDAMSRHALAEREREARIILSQAEIEISEKFVQAASAYVENPTALHLRTMNMVYEATNDHGVAVPSSTAETLGLDGSLATAAMAKQL